MKNKSKIIGLFLGIAVILIVSFAVYFVLSSDTEVTGSAIDNPDAQAENVQAEVRAIKLIFYDKENNCSLNGKLYVDDVLLGETESGAFVLNESEYNERFTQNSSLYIFGRTDYCFKSDANLPFSGNWNVYDLQSYFESNADMNFELDVNPRWPTSFLEMQDFIRPEEAENYFNTKIEKYLENDTWADLDRIADFGMRYRSDSLMFNTSEYWQTAAETLQRGHGDCEDWAVATLSLMRAYDSSAKCYVIVWDTHMSILCYNGKSFAIYDQDETKFATSLDVRSDEEIVRQENEAAIRRMRNNYFDLYGIKPNERRMYAIMNEEEIIVFKDDEDFVDWAVGLVEGR